MTTIMEMMQKDGRSVNGASDEMKGNEAIVISAMLQDRTAREFAAAELKTTTLISTLERCKEHSSMPLRK